MPVHLNFIDVVINFFIYQVFIYVKFINNFNCTHAGDDVIAFIFIIYNG